MNPITKLAYDLTDDDLSKAVVEIIDWHDMAILRDGVVRNIAKQMRKKGLFGIW